MSEWGNLILHNVKGLIVVVEASRNSRTFPRIKSINYIVQRVGKLIVTLITRATACIHNDVITIVTRDKANDATINSTRYENLSMPIGYLHRDVFFLQK